MRLCIYMTMHRYLGSYSQLIKHLYVRRYINETNEDEEGASPFDLSLPETDSPARYAF